MNRGKNGETIFLEDADYLAFIDLLKESTSMWNIKIAAFCLMSNHYHLLLQTPDGNLSRCMRHINGIYTQYFNRNYKKDGSLFRGRYKAIIVDADSYLLQLFRYIHKNPLRAGIVKELKKYYWNSHNAYITNKAQWNWIYKDFILSMLENNKTKRRKAYLRFINEEDSEEIKQFFAKKTFAPIIGSDKFIDKIKKNYFKLKKHKEIPESNLLAPSIQAIKDRVCEIYSCRHKDLLVSKRGEYNEARNIAIYLSRRYTGTKLENIGVEFNIKNYSSVSTVITRTTKQLENKRKLRKQIAKIVTSLNMSQEQT
jgi:REP element-mobilizing transposase RayT